MPPLYLIPVWLWLHKDLLLWGTSMLIISLVVLAGVLYLHWLANFDGMLWVQAGRRLHLLRIYLTTFCLQRRRVTLAEFVKGVHMAYGACGFARKLGHSEMHQLALRAGFPPAAAATLAAPAEPPAAGGDASRQQQRWQQRQRTPQVTIPSWRCQYFQWWFSSHLATLRLLRAEWEQQQPQLVCGFDISRQSAHALLFRRPKGTCLVRLGQEVGGVIVSLRPDKASLPEEQRTRESYFGSVSAAGLAGGAYQLAEQPWMPQQRKLREGTVVHVYVPDASLRLHGGLWGCLRRMRHTNLLLDGSTGEVMPAAAAFKPSPPQTLTPRQLEALRLQLQQQRRQQAEQQHAGTQVWVQAQVQAPPQGRQPLHEQEPRQRPSERKRRQQAQQQARLQRQQQELQQANHELQRLLQLRKGPDDAQPPSREAAEAAQAAL